VIGHESGALPGENPNFIDEEFLDIQFRASPRAVADPPIKKIILPPNPQLNIPAELITSR
jgi:hypothetical protein